jgi:hydroxymethylbilane synthase
MTSPVLRIGSRGSPLALKQAEIVRTALIAVHPDLAEPGAIDIVPIRTTGDRIQDRTLAEAGGKGLFTKEIEEALLAGAVDLAVHSAKDMQTWLPNGLVLGAVLGTASLRRQAQALMRRPDLKVVPFRGNVETRLKKLSEGLADATLLALAGLKRLDRAEGVGVVLDPEEMLPAAGQGVIAVEIRAGDRRMEALLGAVNHPTTAACLEAERALLAALDGSCRTPIAALAEPNGEDLRLRALIALPDGSQACQDAGAAPIADAALLGNEVGLRLADAGGKKFLRGLR